LGKKKGQALLELALFGAFLLMILGVMVNYGLRYYFQMKVKTEAFRNTLAGAASDTQANKPSAVSSMYIRDKYIPEASAPFGYTMPISASASGVNRNPDMRIGPDNDAELPMIQIYMDNNAPMNFSSGRFIAANYTTTDQLDKYREIYGDALGCSKWNSAIGACNTTAWVPIYDSEGKISDSLRKCCGTNSTSCKTGGAPAACPGNYTLQQIKYVDSVDGQLMDYGSAVRQCRQLVDSYVCTFECMKGSTGVKFANVTKCSNICNQTINIPWYCGAYNETNTTLHTYNFTNLNSIFGDVARKTGGTLGVQPSYDKTSHGASFVELNADSAYLQAQDVLCFSDKTRRWVVYRPVNATGNQTNTAMVETNVSSAITIHEKTEW